MTRHRIPGWVLMVGAVMTGNVAAGDADSIYGHRLMSPFERAEYKAELRSLQSEEELRLFLEEHREEMDERAQQQGVKLDPVPLPSP